MAKSDLDAEGHLAEACKHEAKAARALRQSNGEAAVEHKTKANNHFNAALELENAAFAT